MVERTSELTVAGIGGSLRENSYSYLALEYAMRVLIRMGCRTRVMDLRKTNLPFCNGDKVALSVACPAVAELQSMVSSAQALVLATPEYHGSLSGVMKNTLDLLDQKHLEGKVAGLISVLGGPADSNALNDLSRIMRSCHAWVIPHHIAIGYASTAFVEGETRDMDLHRRFDQFARSLVQSACQLHGCAPSQAHARCA
jgi:FMN reductase